MTPREAMTKRTRHTPPPSLQAYLQGPPAVSQRALAAAIGCTQSMISMLVQGKRVPSGTLATRLHAVTQVPLAVLLGNPFGTVQAPKPRRRPNTRGNPEGRHTSP